MSDEQRRRRRGRPGVGTMVVATAFVAYGTYQLAQWAWKNWIDYTDGDGDDDDNDNEGISEATTTQQSVKSTEEISQRLTPEQRRNLHRLRKKRLLMCREETRKSLEGFLPSLRIVIEEATDATSSRKMLKQLRKQERRVDGQQNGDNSRTSAEAAYWMDIQVCAVTRMITTAYSYTFLFVILTVQVHLLSGRLFRLVNQNHFQKQSNIKWEEEEETANKYDFSENHRKVLTQTLQHFLQHSVPLLLKEVRLAVEKALDNSDWNILVASSALHMTFSKFEATIRNVRNRVECGDGTSANALGNLFQQPSIAVSQMQGSESELESDSLLLLLGETWDILESPVVLDALRDCLDTSFQIMHEIYLRDIFREADGCIDRPLAYVISHLKSATCSFFDSNQQNCKYSSALESLPTMIEAAEVSFN